MNIGERKCGGGSSNFVISRKATFVKVPAQTIHEFPCDVLRDDEQKGKKVPSDLSPAIYTQLYIYIQIRNVNIKHALKLPAKKDRRCHTHNQSDTSQSY